MGAYGDRMRGLLRALFPKHEPQRVPDELAFLEREDSFCLVFFQSDVRALVPAFLEASGYRGLATKDVSGPFPELYESLGEVSGPRNNVVLKAVYLIDGYAVLADPEMVAANDVEKLSAFCAQHGVRALSATWERYSQTVLVIDVGPSGVTRSMDWLAGSAQTPDCQPWAEIVSRPNSAGIKAALATAGVPIAAAFGQIDATILQLEE